MRNAVGIFIATELARRLMFAIDLSSTSSGTVDYFTHSERRRLRLFQNWWAHCERLNTTNAVVVVAEDESVGAKLKTNSNITVEQTVLNLSNAHTWRSKGYKAIVSTCAQHVLRHLL